MEKKKTIGEISAELLEKADGKQGVVDTQREADKEYISEIKKCIVAHSDITTPFYIVVILKKEKTMANVMRRYFLARISLPTPEYDQQVWRYDPSTGDLEFLWCLPDKNTCMWLANESTIVHKENAQLVEFVLDFLDKKLYDKFFSREKKRGHSEDDQSRYDEQIKFIEEHKREEASEKSNDVKHGGNVIH